MSAKLITAFGLVAALAAIPSPAQAQVRARAAVVMGRAAPLAMRAPAIIGPAFVRVAPYRPYVVPGVALGFSYGYPYYGRYAYYGPGPYAGYGYPYGYPYPAIGLAVRAPISAFGVRVGVPASRWAFRR